MHVFIEQMGTEKEKSNSGECFGESARIEKERNLGRVP